MKHTEEMDIHEVLDYINEKFNYYGIDNSGKITDNRDDLISKNAFHNWIRRYNEKIKINNKGIQNYNKRASNQGKKTKPLLEKIKPIKKSSQNKDTFYKKKDVDKLIDLHESSLKEQYLKKTEEVWTGWNQDIRKRIPSSIVKAREVQEEIIEDFEKQEAILLKDAATEIFIKKFLNEEKLLKDCELYVKNNGDMEQLNIENYIKRDLLK